VTARVEAAGGVIVRRADGGVVVAVVHRPKYDDWTLPKGKLDPGEGFEQAALREVEEETGLVCRLGREVGAVEYNDRHGRPKLVRYWLMTPVAGRFRPNREVDELRWLPAKEAAELLTYEHDRELVSSAERAAAELRA
jgi:8-oxo-dGTP diphosphatase